MIQVFESADFGTIRALAENGEPWFVAKDVCDALGISKYRDAVSRLDADERGSVLVDTLGGAQEANAVSEPGFYKLVMRSRKPEAKAFQRWVTHEVLPAIRRDGGYMAAKPDETPEEVMARALRIADETMRRQKERIESLSSANAEMRPKALFADAVAASDGTCLVGELAKMIAQNGVDIGQNRLFVWMREKGYLGKSGCNYNRPTQRSIEMGILKVKETAVHHADGHVTINSTPKVTGKGQVYFVQKFLGEKEARC